MKRMTSSVRKSQVPIGCKLCETGKQIKYKCIECDLLMCETCTNKFHAKTCERQVISIKNIGQNQRDSISGLKFKMKRQFGVEIRHVHLMTRSPDGSLFIADWESGRLQHVEIDNDRVKVISRFNIKVYGLAISPLGSLLIVPRLSTILKIYDPSKREIMVSNYSVHPMIASSVHVSNNDKIIVGAHEGHGYHGAVIIMNQDGKHLQRYDNHDGQHLFKLPCSITTGINGSLFVSDWRENRVVTIRHDGEVKFYDGNPDINSPETPFKPRQLIRAHNNNVLIIDYNTDCFHIVNSDGEGIAYHSLGDIGIRIPCSLALSPPGSIIVGCANKNSEPEKTYAKFYELDMC